MLVCATPHRDFVDSHLILFISARSSESQKQFSASKRIRLIAYYLSTISQKSFKMAAKVIKNIKLRFFAHAGHQKRLGLRT